LRYERDGFSVRAAKAKGRALDPDHWYLNPPPSFPGIEWFFEAYRDLSTDRRFEGGPIPRLSAMAYADRKGLAPDVAETMWAIVHRMDNAERAWRLDEIKSGAPGA
jgi:hypothetical protein